MKKLLLILLLCVGCDDVNFNADDARKKNLSHALWSIRIAADVGETSCTVDYIFPETERELIDKGFNVKRTYQFDTIPHKFIITWHD